MLSFSLAGTDSGAVHPRLCTARIRAEPLKVAVSSLKPRSVYTGREAAGSAVVGSALGASELRFQWRMRPALKASNCSKLTACPHPSKHMYSCGCSSSRSLSEFECRTSLSPLVIDEIRRGGGWAGFFFFPSLLYSFPFLVFAS